MFLHYNCFVWAGISRGQGWANCKVGEDENPKYENPSPLLTNESHCQHQKATANYSWKVSSKQRSQLRHYHQADPLLRFDSPNRGWSLENFQGPSLRAKMESETSTWEIQASETTHLKSEETSYQIDTGWWQYHNPPQLTKAMLGWNTPINWRI